MLCDCSVGALVWSDISLVTFEVANVWKCCGKRFVKFGGGMNFHDSGFKSKLAAAVSLHVEPSTVILLHSPSHQISSPVFAEDMEISEYSRLRAQN